MTCLHHGTRIKIKKKCLHDFYYSCGIRQGGVISRPFCVSLINDSRNKHKVKIMSRFLEGI